MSNYNPWPPGSIFNADPQRLTPTFGVAFSVARGDWVAVCGYLMFMPLSALAKAAEGRAVAFDLNSDIYFTNANPRMFDYSQIQFAELIVKNWQCISFLNVENLFTMK